MSGPARSEEAISEGETRFRTIFENSGSGIVLVDMQGHPVKSNPALQKILGYTEEELSGMVFTEFTHSDDRELDWGLYRELIAGKRDKYEIEKRFITKDGRVIWGSLIATLVRDEEGLPKYVVGMVQDITERKNAEEELRRVSERLTLATRAANIGIWDWDLARGEAVWDDAMYGLYGIRKEDAGDAFEAWSKSLAPEDSEQAHAELQAALRGEREFDSEFRIVWPDGSIHFIKAGSQTFRDEEGQPVRMVGVNYDITAVRESEQRSRQLADNLREVLWLYTPDYSKALYISPAYESVWGRSCDSLYRDPHSFLDAVHEDDRARVEETIKRDHTRGVNQEYRIVKPDGTIRWIWDRGFPIKDESGNVYRIAGIAEDITERRLTQDKLRASEERFAKAFHASPVPIVILRNRRNRDRTFLEVNERWETAFGYSREETIGRTALELNFLNVEDRDRLRALGERQNFLRDEEVDVRTKQGEIRHVMMSAERFMNEGELYNIVLFNDITERKRAEEALRRSEENFRRAFESSPAPGGIIRARDRRHLKVNSAFVRTLGYTAEEVVGKTAAELGVWPDGREQEELWQKLPKEKSVKGYETRIYTKSGEMMDILLYVEAIEMSGEQCFMASIIDITERKLAEEKLKASHEQLRALSERLRKAKDEEGIRIARELHDELGAALTSLKWSLTRLREDCSGGANAGGDTQSKIGGMVSLVDATINTVRRISSELRPGVLEDLGLIPAIEWHAHQVQANTGIVCRFESQVENVELSRERATTVFRIFQEAMTNVLRHAGATRVNILVEEDDDEFVLEVSDNGRGITDSEKLGTSSLGLLGMRERAHSVGGRVEINGTPGKGTTLIVRVPLPSDGRM